jgi:hypothetical protein
VQVAGLLVQPGSEGVAEGVDGDWSVDTGRPRPIGEPQLDLPSAQSMSAIGPKKRRIGPIRRRRTLCAVFLEVAAHEPPEPRIQKHTGFGAAIQRKRLIDSRLCYGLVVEHRSDHRPQLQIAPLGLNTNFFRLSVNSRY